MAHHQHHGPEYEAQMSRSLSTRPVSPHATSMPSISEDEQLAADADEPPDHYQKSAFTKHSFQQYPRRHSLLSKALHTDSESHDEDASSHFRKIPSVSSTYSVRSQALSSDEGHASPSTRPSTPGSPRSVMSALKLDLPLRQVAPAVVISSSIDSHHESDSSQIQSPEKEAAVEAKLGRKRCIMFACGGTKTNTTAPQKPPTPEEVQEAKPAPTILKRPCTIKFNCPFKADKGKDNLAAPNASTRHLSPAPAAMPSAATRAFHRRHRGSDTTIRNASPTTPKSTPIISLSPRRTRRFSQQSDIARTEATRFHEFASEEEEVDDWTQESTCHKTRLTVADTLRKETDIRRLAEEADEEEAMEEEMNDNDDDDDLYSDDDDVSDTGFQTDDEEGFAASDDGDESDSDYEWWAPRRGRAHSPYVGHNVFRPLARTCSNSSLESDDGNGSPKSKTSRGRHGNKRTRPVQIRPGTPELPDSTDFVCGTLDEDRPMEEAYASCLELRRAAKHRDRPQDIDPTFPLSDPEIGSDDDDDAEAADDSEGFFIHGRPDKFADEDNEPRGRRLTTTQRSPVLSPTRLRSPPPPKMKKSCANHRSPAPISIFNHSSPRRMRSPPPPGRLASPPPSRRGSMAEGVGMPFLSMRGNAVTHTASLPRSPHPFSRRRQPTPSRFDRHVDEEDEGDASDRTVGLYTRGAIDIAQGLEHKRLKRREKFYQRYLRKEEKKEKKSAARGRVRPCPGKGAQRMRQVGIDCAVHRGRRMLSI